MAATVLGVISSAISIFNFGQELFKADDNSVTSNLRVYAGFNGSPYVPPGQDESGPYKYNGNDGDSNPSTNLDGDAPDVRVWNDAVTFLGINTDSGYIGAGNFKDIEIGQGSDNSGAAYALMTANNNAICIAYTMMTWADNQRYGWTGGWGRQCGINWYPSGVAIDGKYSDCVWIDADGNLPVTAIQVHFTRFNDKGSYQANRDVNAYCNTEALRFDYDNDPNYIITKRDGGLIGGLLRNITGNVFQDSRLVKSMIPSHSAIDVCESETSVGPDFVSMADGMYCDMGKKEVLPLCVPGSVGRCFSLETTSVLLDGLLGIVESVFKYSSIEEWAGVEAKDLVEQGE